LDDCRRSNNWSGKSFLFYFNSSDFLGYVFGSEEIGAAQSGVLQAMFSNQNSTPVVTIAKAASDESASMKEDALFNFGPSPKAMASALAKFLRQMHWTYVNVVLDRSVSRAF